MNISITIMAHPKRADAAQELFDQLQQYPFSEISITWDQRNEEWDTGKRSLQAGIGVGDWHVVIQDDALLTPNFYENIEGAINAVPEKVLISLYTGTVKPMPEQIISAVSKAYYASWLKYMLLLWGVGIVIPSDHIEPLLEFVDTPEFNETLYDMKIGMFYQRHRLPIYYTVPSLVDHDDDMGSLIGTDAKEPRRAHRLADGVVLWNRQSVTI